MKRSMEAAACLALALFESFSRYNSEVWREFRFRMPVDAKSPPFSNLAAADGNKKK